MKNRILLISFFFVCMLPVAAREYDGEILDHTSYIQVSTGKLVRTDTVTYLINNRQAEHLAQIYLGYNKGEKLVIGDSWIEDKYGSVVRKLKKGDIEDVSAVSNSSLYEDRRVKVFTLKHNVYPYKIVVSYKVTLSKFFHIVSWNPNPRVPTRNMKLVVETNSDYPIRYKQENVAPPLISEIGGMKRIEWNGSYIPVKREVNAPWEELKIPEIVVIPLNFKYGVNGSMESWQAYGEWISKLNAKTSDLPQSEKDKVDGMISGITGTKERVSRLYAYLQNNTRYVNVSIKVGGLKSYPASYVAQNKYGDCKALCNYMLCLLEHAGIKSYYTLIQAGDEIEEIDKTFPMQAFNHVILTVPLENDTIFLECTSKNIPAGYLGTFTQGRQGLIIDGMNSRFITTPPLSAEDAFSTRHIMIPLKQGVGSMDMKMNLRGRDYEEFSFLESGINRNEAEKYIRNHIVPGTANLTDVEFGKKSRDVPEISVIAKLQIGNIFRKMGSNLLLTSFPHNLPAYEAPDKRSQSVRLEVPYHYCDTIVYQMNSDCRITNVPEDVSIQSEYGNYRVNYRIEDQQFIVEKYLLIHSGHYPVDKYKTFYNFISEIKNHEKNNIYINQP